MAVEAEGLMNPVDPEAPVDPEGVESMDEEARELRRLAYAVLMPGFDGTEPPRWLLDALAGGLGSVCYFGHNLESAEQTARLSEAVHAAGEVLIAMDEEGGAVSRLHVRAGSPHVGAAVLGSAGDPELTRAVARNIARDVRAAGVDMALAPVLDVNSNPANPVIGVRSFGSDPDVVATHSVEFVRAFQDEGVAACAKHFPGHGDTSVDSHVGLPVVTVDLPTLRARDLPPFAAAVAAGVHAVMTSHIVFPALDDRMATVSPAVLGLLREDLGFDGVIVSDAMDMRAVTETLGLAGGTVAALAAGVDLVCLGNPGPGAGATGTDEEIFRTTADEVVAAVADGRLPRRRLAEAAARVRRLTTWCAQRREPDWAEYAAARQALRVRGEVAGTLRGEVRVVDVRRRRNIASGRLSGLTLRALAEALPGTVVDAVFAPTTGSEGRADAADLAAATAPPAAGPRPGDDLPVDVLVTGTPRTDPLEAAELDRQLALHPDAVVLCLGWPSGPDDIPAARRAVFTYGDSWPTARAATALLTGSR
ncbi:glycoside hydrolase family 3 protein [Actinacidiphila yeochonensis]|uniref:glycoside hydrolase family 3 protein n=1 Tax=Actinacidiphila yeochonensis TaxID=89050 RepID=UPI000B270A18|nr:glycoside hydrolase family 3 N-terminal domain-containing protein [Actinacidiphila yeochonensis]